MLGHVGTKISQETWGNGPALVVKLISAIGLTGGGFKWEQHSFKTKFFNMCLKHATSFLKVCIIKQNFFLSDCLTTRNLSTGSEQRGKQSRITKIWRLGHWIQWIKDEPTDS